MKQVARMGLRTQLTPSLESGLRASFGISTVQRGWKWVLIEPIVIFVLFIRPTLYLYLLEDSKQ